MKTIKNSFLHFLTVNLICLQFLLAPIITIAADEDDHTTTANQDSYADQYEGDDYMLDLIVKCDEIYGTWDSSLNTCKANVKDKDDAAASEACAQIEDATERNACFEKVAEDLSKTGDGSALGDKIYKAQKEAEADNKTMLTLGIVQMAVAAVIGDTNSSCYSVKIASYTGLANSLALFGVYFFMDDESEELREKYEENVADSTFEGQTEAFKFLREEQELLKEGIEREEMIHRFTAYGYTAAAIMGIVEGIKPDITGCKIEERKSDKATEGKPEIEKPKMGPQTQEESLKQDKFMDRANKERVLQRLKNAATDLDAIYVLKENDLYTAPDSFHSPRVDYYNEARRLGLYDMSGLDSKITLKDFLISATRLVQNMSNVLIPTAIAKEKKSTSDYVGMGAGAVSFAIQMMKPMIETPIRTQLAHPFSVAALSTVNAIAQFKLAAHDKMHIELLDKKIELLDETLAKFGALNARYCLEGRDDLADPGCYCYNEDGSQNTTHSNSQTCIDYWKGGDSLEFLAAGTYGGKMKNACITVNEQYDPNCKCTDYIDKKTGENACKKAGDFSTLSVSLSDAAGLVPLSNTADEVFSGDSTSMADFSGNTGAQLAASQDKLKKLLSDKYNKMLAAKGKPSIEEYGNKFMEGLLKKVEGPLNAHLASNSGGIGLSAPAQKELDKALSKTGLTSQYSKSSGMVKSGKKKKDVLDFRLANSNSASKTLSFMDKKYKVKKDDISKRKGESIFKMISSRYLQTGMERLFPDDE